MNMTSGTSPFTKGCFYDRPHEDVKTVSQEQVRGLLSGNVWAMLLKKFTNTLSLLQVKHLASNYFRSDQREKRVAWQANPEPHSPNRRNFILLQNITFSFIWTVFGVLTFQF